MEATDRRSGYLALFEEWLSRALRDEAAPPGLDPALLAGLEDSRAAQPPPDLYTLFEALTTLAQEVKLQGRAFKGLADALPPLLERVEGLASRHDDALAEARRIAAAAFDATRSLESVRVEETEDRCFQESVELLLDLRDRLARNVAEAEALLLAAQGPSPLARLWPRLGARARARSSAVRALLDGNRLTLDHLDDALRSRGVSAIACLGEAFEPGRMSAVDVVHTAAADDGAVVEVYRPGYEWNGVVLRAAEVKVARRPEAGGAV